METNCFLSVLILCCLLHCSISWSLTDITIDEDTILTLKTRIAYDPNNVLATNWSRNTFVCNWIGITCGVRHHRVVALNISHLGFTGTVPSQLGNLSFLAFLDISNNSFYGSLPYELARLHRLKYVNFNHNQLSGEIPHEIGNLHNLEVLMLADNYLVGVIPAPIFNISSGTFPSFITNSSKLKYLEMGVNSFSGFIPITIGNSLTNLEWLGLAFNYFTSSTPDLSFLTSLSNSKNLRAVVLSANPLNGFLPGSIGNLSVSLDSIYIKSCNISGSIPKEIGNLKNLMMLDLSRNELAGLIPSTLKNLQNLQGLSLEYNKLEGFIIDDLCHLDNLVELYMESNMLSGVIPACLGYLATLRLLLLGSNRLASVIPSSLWKLKDILHLNLSSNSLTGTLPLDFGNMKKFLDLSNNNLSGVIPSALEALKYLNYLNLSFNQLEGRIPTQGPFANFSGHSFMMNHALCGFPKQQVPPCKRRTHPKSRINLVLAISLPLTFIVFVTLVIVLSVCRKKRSIQPPNNSDIDVSSRAIWRRISHQELVRATNGFSESNLLGKGSFGSVFKGRLLNGMEIAVKVFNIQFERSLESFEVECEVMSGIRHRNLVKIISCCTTEDFKSLVLEYMHNGSLEKCLYSNEYFLDILQRLNIMIDVASALEYLHFDYSIPVVHCDVKPSNVLLDQSMVAHLSDFGIAKLLGEE
ncbi:hypothetical protein Q3G72_022237 [Acer saccharum]|nr:hypothetical protein Q3G72_022237 [Acer saccharum]